LSPSWSLWALGVIFTPGIIVTSDVLLYSNI
jgi:hypothetical protein